VIQSSWGPTLVVFLESIEEIEKLKRVGCRFPSNLTRIKITSANNRGFKLTRTT
jgi:predicted sugar kinase